VPGPQLTSLLAYVREKGRVCPMPGAWTKLHRLLGDDAPPPLILAAWHVPALWKILRLREQIGYAAEHGKLDRIDRFLRGLREDAWYHWPAAAARAQQLNIFDRHG
jgi:hypothetical protein